jgi:hypothetical protein
LPNVLARLVDVSQLNADARLRINGDDMWIKDNVDLYVRFIREKATSFDTLAWIEDADWSYIATWSRDVAMSTDSSEGVTTWNLILN